MDQKLDKTYTDIFNTVDAENKKYFLEKHSEIVIKLLSMNLPKAEIYRYLIEKNLINKVVSYQTFMRKLKKFTLSFNGEIQKLIEYNSLELRKNTLFKDEKTSDKSNTDDSKPKVFRIDSLTKNDL